MVTVLLSALVFGVVVLAMSVGVLTNGRRLRGSCGASGEDCSCSPLAARRCELRKLREAQTDS